MSKDWQEAAPPGTPDGREGRGETVALTVILPCFNESENIDPVYENLSRACQGLDCEFIFVDDGSADETGKRVETLRQRDPSVRLLRFLRNAGHQHALRAGYRAARGVYVLTMDADLQHPPEL